MVILKQTFASAIFLCLALSTWGQQFTEEDGLEYITYLDKTFCDAGNAEMVARWDYITNITQHNEVEMNKYKLAFQELKKEATSNITNFNWTSFDDKDLARQAKFYFSMGSKLTTEELQQMNELQTLMESTYSTAKICDYDEDPETCVPTLELEPEITEIFSKSRNAEQLKHAWIEWHKASGNKYRQAYLDFIDLNNDAAKSLGFDSLQDQWLERYENEDFPSVIQKVWTEEISFVTGQKISLEKFYKQLHAFVRRKLRTFYANQGVNIQAYGYIPAHLLGNMWAQQWDSIEDIVRPFNDTDILDVTDNMVAQNYTAEKMFRLSESFFTSLGFDPMTDTFWEKSMIEKPEGREVVCHASAEEFYRQEDFRIKMCTTITHSDLVTVHHEMGHIVYFMKYKHLPFVYREASNPGFHEAIGDTMALAVNTPTHLESIGLLKKKDSARDNIAYLFHGALEKIAFLPFAYTMDSWRWSLFTGKIDDTNLNDAWWKLREDLQGLSAPNERTENDFDAGAKYHIPANVPYIRYFVSFVVQFQFYEALCKKSGQYNETDPAKPLFLCDFSVGGEETGELIRNMMSLGFSKSWPDALQNMTGSPVMSAESLIKYFLPLYDFLEQENARTNECIGWGADCETHAQEWLNEVYEKEHRTLDEKAGQKDWEYSTNINDQTAEAALAAAEELAKYDKTVWFDNVTQYDYQKFKDPETRRRFELLSVLGKAALPEDRLSVFNKIVSNMTTVYGSAKVCPFDHQNCDLQSEGLTLEPGLEDIMGQPDKHSWDELSYTWEKWRDATGRQMRDNFKNYIDIYNEAANANDLPDASVLWLVTYTRDDPDFRPDLETLWQQMEPLYQKLHAYVRFRLRQFFGEDKFDADAPIPAHLLGNMWAQTWENAFKIVSPFSNVTNPLEEVNEALIAQNYTARGIFELSNDFYKVLGLSDMTMCFDTPCGTENTPENIECVAHNPMIEKPDWDVVCHASAWDMYKAAKDDYRIKMCTGINLEDLVTIHHEMGHIQYYLQYADKPLQFRNGANNGFHEAIGDTMALAVQTPKHLQSVGLLQDVQDSYEADINYLLKSAMEKLAFLPFGYAIDRYRWALFDGTSDTDTMNYYWWQLREKYQGLAPPVNRSEADFDAGAKYHVAADVPYIRYFAAHLLEYMFYQRMCLDSKQYDPTDPNLPLYRCDFSIGETSHLAGERLKKTLQYGSSKPWPDVLEDMTGSRKIDAGPIIEYFAPLSKWLDDQILAHNISVGWKSVVDDFFPQRQQ